MNIPIFPITKLFKNLNYLILVRLFFINMKAANYIFAV